MKNLILVIQDVEKDSPEMIAHIVQQTLEAQQDACVNIAPTHKPRVVTITPQMKEKKQEFDFHTIKDNLAKIYDLCIGNNPSNAIVTAIKNGDLPEIIVKEIHVALKEQKSLSVWVSTSYGSEFYNAISSIAYLVSEGAYKI